MSGKAWQTTSNLPRVWQSVAKLPETPETYLDGSGLPHPGVLAQILQGEGRGSHKFVLAKFNVCELKPYVVSYVL